MVDQGTSSDDVIDVKYKAVNTEQSWLKSYENNERIIKELQRYGCEIKC